MNPSGVVVCALPAYSVLRKWCLSAWFILDTLMAFAILMADTFMNLLMRSLVTWERVLPLLNRCPHLPDFVVCFCCAGCGPFDVSNPAQADLVGGCTGRVSGRSPFTPLALPATLPEGLRGCRT